MNKKIVESYSWLSPDFTINDDPGNKVIIKGPALFSVEKYFDQGVSRNSREYIQDELIRSARTLTDSYIDVNHEYSKWIEEGRRGSAPRKKGHVLLSEEENGVVEYAAEINDREYAQKIRDTDKVRRGVLSEEAYFEKWGKGPLQGVSVDADFVHMVCSKCHKKFYNAKDYEHHMINEEYNRNFRWTPRQIRFRGLSLVEPPETPGVLGASFEIVECVDGGFSQLLETVINEHKEKLEYEKLKMRKTDSIKAEGVTVIPRPTFVAGIREQDEEHQCGEGEHWDNEQQACVANEKEESDEQSATEQDEHGCGEGEHWSEEEGKCVADTPEENVTEQDESDGGGVTTVEEPEETEDDQNTKAVPAEEPFAKADEAPVDEPIVVPEVKPPEETVLGEIKLPSLKPETSTRKISLGAKLQHFKLGESVPKMRLGEPFGGYADFADCVAKNSDKENPEAYCGQIKHETEKEVAYKRTVEAKINEFADAINGLTVEVPVVSYERAIREAVTPVIGALQSFIDSYNMAQSTGTEALQSLIDAFNNKQASMQTELSQVKVGVNEAFKGVVKEERLKEAVKPVKQLEQKLTELQSVKESLENRLKEHEEKEAEYKATVEKVAGQRNEIIEKQQADLESLKVVQSQKQNKLEETVGSLTVKIENLHDQLKPQFKGKHVRETSEDTGVPTGKDPLREAKN